MIESICGTIESICGTIESICGIVESICAVVESICGIVESICAVVESICGVVESICGMIESKSILRINFQLNSYCYWNLNGLLLYKTNDLKFTWSYVIYKPLGPNVSCSILNHHKCLS